MRNNDLKAIEEREEPVNETYKNNKNQKINFVKADSTETGGNKH